MRRLFTAVIVLLFTLPAVTQTTVTISSTIETPGIDRPGINLGGIASYGSQQLLKSLNYSTGGYFPGTYAATAYSCSAGGAVVGGNAAYVGFTGGDGTFTAIQHVLTWSYVGSGSGGHERPPRLLPPARPQARPTRRRRPDVANEPTMWSWWMQRKLERNVGFADGGLWLRCIDTNVV
jgi:hypothetical protein